MAEREDNVFSESNDPKMRINGRESGNYYSILNLTTPQEMGVYQNEGYHFRGSSKKDYSILGSILGSPYFGKVPNTNNNCDRFGSGQPQENWKTWSGLKPCFLLHANGAL